MLDYPLTDVIDLIRRHLDRGRRNPPQDPQAPGRTPLRRTEVIYRKADDSWF